MNDQQLSLANLEAHVAATHIQLRSATGCVHLTKDGTASTEGHVLLLVPYPEREADLPVPATPAALAGDALPCLLHRDTAKELAAAVKVLKSSRLPKRVSISSEGLAAEAVIHALPAHRRPLPPLEDPNGFPDLATVEAQSRAVPLGQRVTFSVPVLAALLAAAKKCGADEVRFSLPALEPGSTPSCKSAIPFEFKGNYDMESVLGTSKRPRGVIMPASDEEGL